MMVLMAGLKILKILRICVCQIILIGNPEREIIHKCLDEYSMIINY